MKTAVIGTLPFGVKALGTHPRKSEKQGRGKTGLPVYFAEVEFRPGEWLYADEDGIVVAQEVLELEKASRFRAMVVLH